MSTTISRIELQNLRNQFREYLRVKHPDWSDSSLDTTYSDAFFGLNNNIGIDFWSSLMSEEALLSARTKIKDHFDAKGYTGNDTRANDYLLKMRELKEFLDEKHPALTTEWSGKAVSNDYLKSDFKVWMQKQKTPKGNSYSKNTIASYLTALKNATGKLQGLSDAVLTDLFYYNSADEFEEAHRAILTAPNFDEVNKSAGNEAYKYGMIQYLNFLKELGEPSCWIFQGNPKYYDVTGAINALDTITWAVNQSQNEIKAGDKAYIWLSGPDGGIIAAGTILCNPEMKEPDLDDPFNVGEPLKDEPFRAVDIRIERKLTNNIVSRSVLLADERTKKLGVLTFPGATNYRVLRSQEEAIESIIAGTYVRVPATAEPPAEPTAMRRYWLYSPGENAKHWNEFSKEGLMGIGWEEIGDLLNYKSKEEIKAAMTKEWGSESSHKNGSHALWQFANEISEGDIVYAKRGLSTIIGRGIVRSGYFFDPARSEYNNIRKVEWTHNGEWEHPGQAAMKTLTDITPYTEYVRKLEELITGEEADVSGGSSAVQYPDYSEQDFLGEVYMSPERYTTLKGLLLRKKNIILQGAPGVGKTYAAQRLAFSIMGEKDIGRVKVVQFHQSYSYEDFVMGYRPEGTGFYLAKGPFYEFCKLAETDDREYFFIIDEINRGNLSRIFGELLMLIESDKRGEDNAIRLLYADEQFYVPSNLHIIGMMNTADRSLAMIDYALRRRFAFFDMDPAFSSEGFKEYQNTIQNPKFDALISKIEALNTEIAEDPSLGSGFRIGHSYFCTTDVVDDVWISDVIEYEILPLMSEYWFDEQSKVARWTQLLRSVLRG